MEGAVSWSRNQWISFRLISGCILWVGAALTALSSPEATPDSQSCVCTHTGVQPTSSLPSEEEEEQRWKDNFIFSNCITKSPEFLGGPLFLYIFNLLLFCCTLPAYSDSSFWHCTALLVLAGMERLNFAFFHLDTSLVKRSRREESGSWLGRLCLASSSMGNAICSSCPWYYLQQNPSSHDASTPTPISELWGGRRAGVTVVTGVF